MKQQSLRPVLSALVASTLCLSAGAALAAPGKITGISAQPSPAKVGEKLVFKVQATGDLCAYRIEIEGHQYKYDGSANSKTQGGAILNNPNTPGELTLFGGLNKAGTFDVLVYGMSGGALPNCQGSAQMKLTVQASGMVAAPVGGLGVAGSFTPLHCQQGFTESSLPQSAKDAGELTCTKQAAFCPENYIGQMDQATGKLVCEPKPGACPDGWSGGMQNGKLVCNPNPQPTVKCPDKTPSNQWGASYYKDGWRVYGCSKNMAPPK
jgi:hypothetical protein